MSNKSYFNLTAGIFLIIGILHLLRSIYSWPAIIGGMIIPLWISYVVVIIAAILAYHGLKRR